MIACKKENVTNGLKTVFKQTAYRNSHRRCSMKKLFWKISLNSKENTSTRPSGLQFYLKRDSGTRFSCWLCKNFEKTSGRPLLCLISYYFWYQVNSSCKSISVKKYMVNPILYHWFLQKQSFTDLLQNRCSWKFRGIHRKAPVLKSRFNKVAGLQLY